jgi:hypothetical protein
LSTFICLSFANLTSACTLFVLQKVNFTSETTGQLVTLNWAGTENDIHRVQAVANVPEGGVFWSIDTQVKGSDFTFKLPSNFAVLKAQVSKNCDDSDLANVQIQKPIAFINEKHTCSLDAKEWLLEGSFIKFKPRVKFLNYSFALNEVHAFNSGNLNSNLLKKFDVNPPYLLMEDDRVIFNIKDKLNLPASVANRKLLVTVLPHCASGTGLPLAFIIN